MSAMSDWGAPQWEIKIEHDGIWPMPWTWRVAYSCFRDKEYHSRFGSAFSKDAAHRKVAAARRSIERDDLQIREIDGVLQS